MPSVLAGLVMGWVVLQPGVAVAQCAMANAMKSASQQELQRRLNNINTLYQTVSTPFIQAQNACISAINFVPTTGLPGIDTVIDSIVTSGCNSAVNTARSAVMSEIAQEQSQLTQSVSSGISKSLGTSSFSTSLSSGVTQSVTGGTSQGIGSTVMNAITRLFQ